MSPVGSIIAWHKTFLEKSSTGSRTNTSTSATQLIDTSADFITDGITAGMIVHNEDDNEFAIVETVVDLNTLTLVSDLNAGTTDIDTFNASTGVNYAIYGTPELPDNWLECNGQTVSDADSPYNGATLPDLNASSGTARFLRGAISSGATGGSETHSHTISPVSRYNESNIQEIIYSPTATGSTSTLPSYFEIVWIMRVK